MDVQAEINWLKSELDTVRDPHLIEAFKQLLMYRNSLQGKSTTAKQELLESALQSNNDVKAGKTHSVNEVEDLLQQRFG